MYQMTSQFSYLNESSLHLRDFNMGTLLQPKLKQLKGLCQPKPSSKLIDTKPYCQVLICITYIYSQSILR